jgi:hypothetical protein
MGAQTANTPNPPPPPRQPISSEEEGVFSAHEERWRQQSLDKHLAATREELAAMKELIAQLPEIFEQRFALRMEPLLAHRERLVAETQQLRHDLLHLQAHQQPANLPVLPPAQPRQPRLVKALRHAFGLRVSA